jgi:hypothetical protein
MLGMLGHAPKGAARCLRALLLVGTSFICTPLLADQPPPGWQAQNLELVGFTGLKDRPGAFKLALNHSNGKWYLYAGHSFDQGWSIIDVTDPKNPRYVKYIEYKTPVHEVLTAQMTIHDNLLITAIDKESKTDPAIILWDISDPENPKRVGSWKGAEGGSHRNTYPGGKYAYLSSFAEGYQGRGHEIVIVDVSNPADVKQVSVFAQPGQKKGETLPKEFPPGYHGPVNISPDGKMMTAGFTPDIVNVDISDIAHPKLIGRLTMVPPFMYAGNQSVHTVLANWDRKILFASSEASKWGCDESPMNWAAMIDNKDPKSPRLMSLFPTPRPPQGLPYKDFCDKGGRFGPHNTVMEQHNPAVHRQTDRMYVTWFNAGLRAFDVSDPYLPTEVGWFMPPERADAKKQAGPHAAPTNWMEDVTEDSRGYIYADDDKWGIWILRDPSAP